MSLLSVLCNGHMFMHASQLCFSIALGILVTRTQPAPQRCAATRPAVGWKVARHDGLEYDKQGGAIASPLPQTHRNILLDT